MGKIYRELEYSKKIFERFNSSFGFYKEEEKLENIMLDGPIQELSKTEYTQPAMLLDGYILHKTQIEKEIELIEEDFDIHALGISFGEITGLLSSGALDMDTTLELVKIRGDIMKEAFEGVKIVRASRSEVAEQIEEFRIMNNIHDFDDDFMLEISLVLSPNMIMLSSFDNSYLKEKKIRSLATQISNAFHSHLLTPSKKKFELFLEEKLKIEEKFNSDTNMKVWSNYSAEPHSSSTIIQNLTQTFDNPVLIQDILEKIKENSYEEYLVYDIGSNNFFKKIIDECLSEEIRANQVEIRSIDS